MSVSLSNCYHSVTLECACGLDVCYTQSMMKKTAALIASALILVGCSPDAPEVEEANTSAESYSMPDMTNPYDDSDDSTSWLIWQIMSDDFATATPEEVHNTCGTWTKTPETVHYLFSDAPGYSRELINRFFNSFCGMN